MYEDSVRKWEEAKTGGAAQGISQKYSGISRATYFRRKRILKDLERGIAPPAKRPKRLRKPLWGEAEKQKILLIRRENSTYGKEKISVILRRDFGFSISVSTVGRILTHLKQKDLITKSLSAVRSRRKRTFKNHAKVFVILGTYKEYKDMKFGERVQIDHMPRKNDRQKTALV